MKEFEERRKRFKIAKIHVKKNAKLDLMKIYRKASKLGYVISFCIMTVVFLTFQKFETDVVQTVPPEVNIVFEDIPQTVQIKAPPPPSRPAIPIASEDEDLMDDVTIEDTEIQFDEIPPPPPPPSIEEDDNIPPFLPFEQQPKIIGGFEALKGRIRYPELAITAKVEGQVIVRTLVNQQGIPEKFQVLKDPGAGCAQAVIDALKETRFTAALQRDRPVKFWLNVPIDFLLVEMAKR